MHCEHKTAMINTYQDTTSSEVSLKEVHANKKHTLVLAVTKCRGTSAADSLWCAKALADFSPMNSKNQSEELVIAKSIWN